MPILDRPEALWTSAAYLLLVILIGVWAARRTRGAKDFFIAGQRLGLLVTALATMAAAFSGFVFIGGPGLTYRLGVASLFICLPVGFTGGLLCWAVAKRLRLLAEVRNLYTVPDAFLCRFGSPTASGLAAVAVLLGTVAYLGAQLQALGVMLDAIFGATRQLGPWGLTVATLAGLAVVVFYSMAGGMIAGVYTDLLQGIMMLAAAGAVFFFALESGGGLREISTAIVQSPDFGPSFLDPFGRVPLVTAVGFFLVFSVGVLGQPHMLHKFYMLKDPAKLRWMPLVLGLGQALCLLIWLGVGLAVPALVARGEMAPLANPDSASPLFLLEHVPAALAGLVFAGILAAIMSTADSFLNVGAAALVRDLPKAFGRKPRRQLARGRWAVLVIALAAALLSALYGDLVALLGTFAFATFGAALAPSLAVGLNWKGITRHGAIASILTGLILNVGLELATRQTAYPFLAQMLPEGVLPGAVSLAASFAVLFVVSSLTAGRPGTRVADDVAAVMEM